MQYAMCGLDCGKCEYFHKEMCKGCHNQQGKIFWGECDVAKCVISKNITTCAECEVFPCELLKSYAYAEHEGDNGERIRNLESLLDN